MISKLLGREPGQFVFVTCTLCGFTETYDLSVYARLNGPSEVDREPEASSAQSA
jgi:predicted nucleic-acid-binding Zn-ribbon protein